MNAALLAFVFAPTDDNIAVTQVPILDPRITKRTSFPPLPITIPATASEITIDVIALLLWKMAVNPAPINSNIKGFVILDNKSNHKRNRF